MPINLRVAENDGESVEKGKFVNEREVNGEKLKTLIEIQDALNKKDKRILRGVFHYEDLDFTTSIDEERESDKFSLELDSFHRIDISAHEGGNQETGLLKKEVKKVSTETFYVIDNKIAYTFNSVGDITGSLNETLDINLKMQSVNLGEIRKYFTDVSSGTWKSVDGKTTSATLKGEITDSEVARRADRSGEPVWIMGEVELGNKKYNIGVSSESNSIVVYGVNDTIQAAELAIDLMSRQ